MVRNSHSHISNKNNSNYMMAEETKSSSKRMERNGSRQSVWQKTFAQCNNNIEFVERWNDCGTNNQPLDDDRERNTVKKTQKSFAMTFPSFFTFVRETCWLFLSFFSLLLLLLFLYIDTVELIVCCEVHCHRQKKKEGKNWTRIQKRALSIHL